MRTPWRSTTLVLALALLPHALPGAAGAQEYSDVQEYEENPIEARVWLDRGNEPVLRRGEGVRVYYRTSEDAFVAIFHIDTNGTIRMVFPNSPQENHYARGGRDYRVLFPGSNYWYVDEDPGMGYFFLVASPEPFNFADLRYSHYGAGWDLSFVGRQVYRDPYLAMDDYVAALIPDWEYVPYGLDFTAYNVEQRYEYPRFMCYDCHGFRPYSAWNPYLYACTSFRVVIYNDPYYYPVTRYRGTRVVYAQPRRGLAHFGFKERAVGEPRTPQVVVRDSRPGVAGTAVRRPQGKESPGAGSTVSPTGRAGGSAPGARIPGVNGGATRRTDPGRSGVTSPTAPGRPIITPPSTGTTGRPTARTRPNTGSTGTGQAEPPATGRVITRPSARARGGGAGGSGTSSGGGGGAGATVRPTVRGGGSGSAVRPTVRSGGSGSTTRPPSSGGSAGSVARPTVRGGGSGGVVRPTVRSGGSSAATRPTVRSGGAGRATVRPPARSGGSSAAVRPPARSGGGAAARTKPTVRSSGGGSRTPPARASSPPVRKKRTGGGGSSL